MHTDSADIRDGLVVCQTSRGLEFRADPLRISRHSATFEIYTPSVVLQISEILEDFKIIARERTIYSGRALIKNLISTGIVTVCETTLEENSWRDVELSPEMLANGKLRAQFGDFMRAFHGTFKVLPEFKLTIADMQVLLEDLRLWLDQIEVAVVAHPVLDRRALEAQVANDLRNPVLSLLSGVFERFEAACENIPPELQPVHRAYTKRQLHPLVLCAPFMHRTYRKPLGYAGDYEMINMMTRDPLEGSSLFAKVLNAFFLDTPPVKAHRNRLEHLEQVIAQEAVRAHMQGRSLNAFSLGCGPATEIQHFILQSELSSGAQFTLLDFNDETLAFAQKALTEAMRRASRQSAVHLLRKPVVHLLKEAAKSASGLLEPKYDLVYCAGLLDYLPDHICIQLMAVLHAILAPGGLLVATNVDPSNPSRNWMEYSVDWHLIYRDARSMARLIPPAANQDDCRMVSEPSGVNTFIEVRKPAHV